MNASLSGRRESVEGAAGGTPSFDNLYYLLPPRVRGIIHASVALVRNQPVRCQSSPLDAVGVSTLEYMRKRIRATIKPMTI